MTVLFSVLETVLKLAAPMLTGRIAAMAGSCQSKSGSEAWTAFISDSFADSVVTWLCAVVMHLSPMSPQV
ncbi:hypothetical protein O3S80_49830, partial [Streptomyces sp. Lzd4kr]|nr:hypothetical protein [Streptomyces sp. Lzd4kr]